MILNRNHSEIQIFKHVLSNSDSESKLLNGSDYKEPINMPRLLFPSQLRGKRMPQRVVCQGCGHVLYDGAELKPPDEILQKFEGKCPSCSKKLSLLPIDVEVKPLR